MSYYNKRIYKGKSLIEKVSDYTVVDIETTSLDSYYGKILEISALKVRNDAVVDTFSEIINTNEEIGYFTTRLTGITTQMVQKEGKDLIKVLKSFLKFLENDIIIGHNVNFDIDFLYDSIEDNLGIYLSNDYIDTLRLSRKYLKNLRHHKLDDLINFYNLEVRDKHRALNDCILTNQVYVELLKLI